jgi:hypothetical protein
VHARRSRSVLVLVLSAVMLAAAACGGDGGTEVASARPVQAKVVVTPETATTPFALAQGNYRVNWATTDCKKVTVKIVGDNGYTKEKSSSIPNFSFIATSIPAGNYTAAQTDPACATWTLTIEKV